jgi:Flp pilus assembly protein TadD
MKKLILSFCSILFIGALVKAQDVNDGIKFINYQRYTSAKQALQKAAADKDPLAIYWLGQAYIGAKQLDSAKIIYQNALTAGVNDPWIWIGSGEVEILQGGDVNAAKQKFEQAITATTKTKGRNKGPNPDILNAVGRAMAAGSSKQGDPNYGIDKLKQAVQQMDEKNPNPDIYLNMGLCYRKLGGDQGGQAFEAFRQASVIAPQDPRAYYLIGKIYESQRNKESMNEWFSKAISADPTFAPVYLEYFNYYAETDVNTAKVYLDKWIANTDKDCTLNYFVGDYLFRAGKYQESLQQAKDMEAGACASYPRLSVLYAYDYDRLGDSVQARTYIQKYLTSADTSEILPSDYALAGAVFAKFPEGADSAGKYFQLAISTDTVKVNQEKYLNSAVDIATRTNNYGALLQLIGAMKTITGSNLSETQYYNISKSIADAAADTTQPFDSAKYIIGDSVIKSYAAAYPDKPQPYAFLVRYAKAADRDTTKGLALPAIALQNQYESKFKDTAASAKQVIFSNDVYLLIYYAQYDQKGEKADNYRKAIDVANEMMALYPDTTSQQYIYAKGVRDQLQGALDKFEKSKNNTDSSGGGGKSKK